MVFLQQICTGTNTDEKLFRADKRGKRAGTPHVATFKFRYNTNGKCNFFK
jgi:hypothetical protein